MFGTQIRIRRMRLRRILEVKTHLKVREKEKERVRS